MYDDGAGAKFVGGKKSLAVGLKTS